MKKVEEIVNRMINNGVIPMNEYYYDICNFICDNLDETFLKIYDEKDINVQKLYNDTLESFAMYGDKRLLVNLYKTLHSAKIIINTDDSDSTKISQFKSSIDTTHKNANGMFSARGIMIPKRYNDLARVYFGHEAHHILKDVNPREYRYMLKYADVIPMFYELVESDKFDDTSKKAIINNRLALLYNIKNEMNNRDLYDDNYVRKIINSKKFQYLNSFYYSVILYRMYKINPHHILNLVKMVLNGEITTCDLINKLGINNRCLDYEVKEEIKVLKK